VLLTLIGIYSVISYATRQRDREVAIRVAVGAGTGSVHRLVLRQALVPVGLGITLGTLAGIAASGLLRGLLHGIPHHDALSYGIATAAFAVVATVACLVPARRAARLDPMRVMRGD
jgi:putative ABC transport system permease protein